MLFVATHNVTRNDVARAVRLGARKVDLLLSIVVVIVLASLLRFETSELGVAALSWLSILITLLLPIFLFYAVRSVADAFHPVWKVRRLIKNSDIVGPTTYTIDDRGIRSIGPQGAEVFLPWTAFDAVQADQEIAVLVSKARPRFFVPLGAFGRERDQLLAEIRHRVPSKSDRGHRA